MEGQLIKKLVCWQSVSVANDLPSTQGKLPERKLGEVWGMTSQNLASSAGCEQHWSRNRRSEERCALRVRKLKDREKNSRK